MPTIDIEQTNTRLRTNSCALSSQWISRHTPLFPYQNSYHHKGIRAQQEGLTATKGNWINKGCNILITLENSV
ncbi:MAG: hypothetical protein LBC02_14735, partial [Planctomycetaceae bacterium]|nr:hypothetical protein [Planctomycetaceae bacterium]